MSLQIVYDWGIHGIVKYWASNYWTLFYLVMRAHRLGSKYGISLSSSKILVSSLDSKLPICESFIKGDPLCSILVLLLVAFSSEDQYYYRV
jgi:hypothetical protein